MESKQQERSPLYQDYPPETPTMDFGGWEMPRDFGGIVEEHKAVRNDAGIFDLSHMGRITVRADDVAHHFQRLFTRQVADVELGRCLYGFLCDPDGGCFDDIIVYVRSDDELDLVVNAGNRDEVVEWLRSESSEITVKDHTYDSVLLAIQGPEAPGWFDRLDIPSVPDRPFRVKWNDGTMVASTGYTGEAGGEVWVGTERGRSLFQQAIEDGLRPCGLGARDTLRLEMGYPLHGHELSREIDPVSANLAHFIDWDHEFIGRPALKTIDDTGPKQVIRGLRLATRRSPGPGDDVTDRSGDSVGRVTSGRYSPTLECGIAMALIDTSNADTNRLNVHIRNEPFEAELLTPPFVGKENQ